jgi:AcrR family transcriptional regulator
VSRVSYEDKRKKIAKVAAKVFSEKGYRGASLQDIAQRVGSPKSIVYHYFKTKEDILANILLTSTDEFIEILESCLAGNRKSGCDEESSFRNLIHAYANFQIKHRVISFMVLKERHQLTGEYKRRLHEKEQKIFHLIKDELSKIPTIHKKLNLDLMTFSIIAMCHWAGYWFNEKGKLSREEAIDQIIKIAFDGIRNADIRLVPNVSRKNANLQKGRKAKSSTTRAKRQPL